jgi:mRNA interferase MazF
MARILRGDIFWADLTPTRGHEQGGERPVLVLSHDTFNEGSGTVIAVVITSQQPRVDFPLVMEIRSVKMPKQSWVKIGQFRTLSTLRLGKRIGHIASDELNRVVEGLMEIVGD